MPGRNRVVAVLLIVGLLLAGCGGVPDSGPPVAVRDQQGSGSSESPEVNVVITGPQVGGEPTETVTGLLQASGTTQQRSRLAEEFVVPEARQEFARSTGALIVQLVETPTAADDPADGETTVQLPLHVVGSLDDGGSYQSESRDVTLSLRLVRRADVWLLASTPPTVLIRDSDLEKALRPVTVYFPMQDESQLVPEQRYVDSSIRTDALATPIVRMLLGGPSGWLATAARTTLPSGARLRGNVAVADREVILDFTPEAESASAADLNLFVAQVGWSLRDIDPTAIRVQVSGRPIAVRGVPSVVKPANWARANPAHLSEQQLYVIQDGAVRGFQSERPAAAFADQPGGDVARAALSVDGNGAAAVRMADGQQQLWIGDGTGAPRSAVTAVNISRPTWGRTAEAVLVAVDGQLLRVTRSGAAAPVEIDAGGADLGPVQAVRLAYDGMRVALVAGDGDAAKTYVGIVRGSDGGRFAVRAVRQLSAPISVVQDVGWAGPTSVLVAGREADGMAAVWDVDIDGSAIAPTPRNGLRPANVSVASAPTEPSTAPTFADLDGQLYQRFRESWTLSAQPARTPFYPG